MPLSARTRSKMLHSMQHSVAIFLVATVTLGCAHMQVSQARAKLRATLNPLLGKSRDEVLMAVGAPVEVRSIGGFEVWDYHTSYGMRARQNAFVNVYNTNSYGHGGSQTWEAYDRFTLYFDASGHLAKWDGYVQR